jgi:diguanylate cyclase (GGDEF)-like protein
VGRGAAAQARAASCRWGRVLLSALHRLVAVILGDDVPSGPSSGVARPDGTGAAAADRRRQTLADVVALSPTIREELRSRARSSGAVIAGAAALILPAWAVVDGALEPSRAALFLVVRLLCAVPMLVCVWLLVATPVGRRWPEHATFAALAVVQLDVAWMIPRVAHVEVYLMGFTCAIFASGCLVVSRPRWTGALVATSWLALAGFLVTAPAPLEGAKLVDLMAYLATGSVIAVIAHVRRHTVDVRELMTRVRLEHEQERSRVLLAQLERLSHEDPLTGLANRRRWDGELVAVCTGARQQGGVVSLLLLDLDHFKRINDAHGHPGGDEALRRVAGLLSAGVRGGDLVARLGGDEFAVLMPGATEERAIALAEEMRCAVADLRVDGFLRSEISLSVGVAAATGGEAFPLELMSRADEQLYRAKITRNAVGARTPAR